MHREPGLNATHVAFLASLPRPAELLAAEVFEERLVAALQAPVLEGLVRGQRGVTEAVYYGSFQAPVYTPLVEELGADKAPDLATFSWLAALVGSRDFVLRSGGMFLLPVADLVNHASGAPNARRDDNGTHVFMVAERAIAAGEEARLRFFVYFYVFIACLSFICIQQRRHRALARPRAADSSPLF
jgi:hypothetical protein